MYLTIHTRTHNHRVDTTLFAIATFLARSLPHIQHPLTTIQPSGQSSALSARTCIHCFGYSPCVHDIRTGILHLFSAFLLHSFICIYVHAGTYTFASKAQYDGDFCDNKFEGTGSYVWPDGRRYDGQWKDSKYV